MIKIKVIPDAEEEVYPMLCESSEPFDGDEWSFEVKWDGERALLYIANGSLKIKNRKGRDISYRYPDLLPIIGRTAPEPNRQGTRTLDIDWTDEDGRQAILDGEIIVLDSQGRSDFEQVAQRSHVENPFDIELRSKLIPVTYVAFDILSLNGQLLTNEPLIKRREILFREFKPIPREETKPPVFQWSLPLDKEGKGKALFEEARRLNLEGLVAKHNQSPYVMRRSPYWRKIKNVKTVDVWVSAYEINNAGIKVSNESGFTCQITGRQSQDVKTIMDETGSALIEVKYLNETKNGKLRMPTFKSLKSGGTK